VYGVSGVELEKGGEGRKDEEKRWKVRKNTEKSARFPELKTTPPI